MELLTVFFRLLGLIERAEGLGVKAAPSAGSGVATRSGAGMDGDG